MFVGLDSLVGLNTPKLQVPTDFKVKEMNQRIIEQDPVHWWCSAGQGHSILSIDFNKLGSE